MDKIIMQGMQFYGYHGALAEEQQLGQRFTVDLQLYLDLQPAGIADDLAKTVSYADVYRLVKNIIESAKYKLIESLAETIASQVLDNFAVKKVTVQVKKPQAPIPGIFDYMAVEITRSKAVAYIAIGSNIGDKKETINRAIALIDATMGLRVTKVAPYYQTAPVGYTEQDWFLNTVIEVETTLSPLELLHRLLNIESQLGRVRTIHWGPRTIDLDLLIYGDEVFNSSELTLPHPRMTERAFVMVPLADINGDLLVANGKTAAEIATELKEQQEIVPYDEL
ncbi:2-amino-4-hydroxy-6-hydroxymethyldihydropteridine diphosphokinase [Peptococcaceae bacterium 1198_IL3148]